MTAPVVAPSAMDPGGRASTDRSHCDRMEFTQATSTVSAGGRKERADSGQRGLPSAVPILPRRHRDREVFTHAPLSVPPSDEAAIAGGLVRILGDDVLRGQFIALAGVYWSVSSCGANRQAALAIPRVR